MVSVEEIKKAVEKIAPAHGVEAVWLFGSYARGDADEKSDINLKVRKGTCRGLKMAAFAVALEEILGKSIDLLSTEILEDEKTELVKSIQESEVLLWEQ